jgi:hypothetical protein
VAHAPQPPEHLPPGLHLDPEVAQELGQVEVGIPEVSFLNMSSTLGRVQTLPLDIHPLVYRHGLLEKSE